MTPILVEHKVLGAPSNERADGVLSVTDDISVYGEILLSEFVGSKTQASNEFSSLLFFKNEANNLYTIIHYQASFTAFPEHNRWYDERAVYEIQKQELQKIDYSYNALIPHLDCLRKYDSREYGVDKILTIKNSPKLPLTRTEENLKTFILKAILQGNQLFIQLDPSDKPYGDEIRTSPKLISILHAIDALPQIFRQYISMAFGVENNAPGFEKYGPDFSIIAHYDNGTKWPNYSSGLSINNWSHLNSESKEELSDKDVIETKLLPLYLTENDIPYKVFIEKIKEVRAVVSNLYQLDINGIKSLSDNDKEVLKKWYSLGKDVYHHQNIAKRLLWLSTIRDISPIKVQEILDSYNVFKDDQVFLAQLSSKIQNTNSFKDLDNIYNNYRNISTISSQIKNKILGSTCLMSECGNNNNKNSALSKEIQSDIQDKVRQLDINTKINWIDNPYYGIDPKSFNINNWKDFESILRKMESKVNSKKIEALPYNINWKDNISEKCYKKISKRLSEEEKKALRERALKNYFQETEMHFIFTESPITNDEYNILFKNCPSDEAYLTLYEERTKNENGLSNIPIDIRCQYALIRIKNKESINKIQKLSGTDVFNEKYTELIPSLTQLLQLLQKGCDKKLSGNDKIKLLVQNELATSSHIRILDNLNTAKHPKNHKVLKKIQKNLAHHYVLNELLSDTDLDKKSFWEDLKTPHDYVVKWFNYDVTKSIKDLSNDELLKLHGQYYDYLKKTVKEDKPLTNECENAVRFINNSARSLFLTLQANNLDSKASEIKPFISQKATKPLLNYIANNKKTISLIGTLAIIIGSSLFFMIPRNNNIDNNDSGVSSISTDSMPTTDSLFYNITFTDSLIDTNSLKWNAIPIDSSHPMAFIADELLDTLFHSNRINTYILMRTLNFDSSIIIHIHPDSMKYASKLLPIINYYNFIIDSIQKRKGIVDATTIQISCLKPNSVDTLHISVSRSNSLLSQIIGNDTLKDCNILLIDTLHVNNNDFKVKNGVMRPLSRIEYYLWSIQQMAYVRKN